MTPSTDNFIMDCHCLSKRFGNILALNNITLRIPSGSIVGLLGPNGSGKTTLLKLAAGLLSPTSGMITIENNAPGPKSKAVVSFLPDRSYFGSWMTVAQCLDYFEDFYADFDRLRAENMLSQLGITAGMRLKKLSKGTNEKVQLVLTMSRRAKLYLLDEPIGGVDPAARDYILDTIITNYSPESSIIISTHLISDVEKILDEYVFINRGHIVEFGVCDDIRQETGKSLDEHFREVFKC
jgi:ABC-2 type transport system ATP-binding protein